MAVVNILRIPFEQPRVSAGGLLRQKATAVSTVDKSIRASLDDLTETLIAAGGHGLAAPQVGIQKRFFVVRNGTEYMKFINPTLIPSAGAQASPEACLSLPGIYGMVRRPAAVTVRALDENGKPFELEATGRLAAALCHEYDHLEGILFTDKAYAVRRYEAPLQPKPSGF